MHVIVTGGAGFIGTWLVRSLIGQGHDLIVLDPVPCCVPGITTLPVSVLDAAALREAMGAADAVIHLAGPIRDAVRRDPYSATMLQVQGTLNVLEACRQNEIARVLLASSFYVYHGLGEETVVDEESAVDPRRMELFSAVKVMAEGLCREYSRKYGLKPTVLRLGSAYGPGGSNVIRTFVEMGLQGQPLEVWGEGKRRNQYTFVGDLANGIVAALHSPGETFNLCSPELTTAAGLALTLQQDFGFPVCFDPARGEEASFPVVDSRKAIEQLHWRPIDLHEGLRRTVPELQRSLSGRARSAAGNAPPA